MADDEVYSPEDKLFIQADELYDQGDLEAAFKLFLKGAYQGYSSAMGRLALMYFDGEAVTRDYEKSIEWDLKAIELGESTSLNNLAITYRCIGDVRKAKYWFEKSLAAGDDETALELAKLYMVSDKEHETVLSYLKMVIDADQKYISEASLGEAQDLLADLTKTLENMPEPSNEN